MPKGKSKLGGGGRNSKSNDVEMVEIARMMTFGTSNNRDIVRRLMATQDSFKGLTFADAMQQFRSYEKDGLVRRTEQYIVIEHPVYNETKRKKKNK